MPSWMTREQVVGLIVVMTGMAVAALDVTVVATALPTAIGELGGIDRYSWVFAAYLLVSTATTPIFGRLADVHGRKRVYLFALVWFVATSMLCGQASSMEQLIAFRAMQGLGAAALLSTGITMISDLFDFKQRGQMQAFTSSVWGTAALVGPVVGGLITEVASWRWTFYVNLPIGLLAIALLLTLPEREEHRGGAIDWTGALTFTAAAAALLLGLNGTLPAVTIPVALACAAVFVVIERRSAEPLVDFSLLRVPVIGAGLAIEVLLGATQLGAATYVPPFAQGVVGRSPIDAGLVLTGMSIAWPIGAMVAGWTLLRLGLRRAVVMASLAPLVGTAILASLVPDSPLLLLGIGATAIGFGQGMTNMRIIVGSQSTVPYRRRGIATSLVNFSRSLGGAIGVAALGATMNASVGPRAAEIQPLLDPHQHAALGAAAAGARAVLGGAIHTVFAALVVLAAATVLLALRLPTHDVDADATERAPV